MTGLHLPLTVAARPKPHNVVFGYSKSLGEIGKNAIVPWRFADDANLIGGEDGARPTLSRLILNGAVDNFIGTIFLRGFPGQIARYIVSSITILVRGLVLGRGRMPIVCDANEAVNETSNSFRADLEPDFQIASAADVRGENIPCRKAMAGHAAANTSKTADFIFRSLINCAPFFLFHGASNGRNPTTQQRFQRALQAGGMS